MAPNLIELVISSRNAKAIVTQTELGDTTGLSTVHMNRTLQELRVRELIILRARRLTIPNLDRLKEACLFSSGYLHLDKVGQEFDANEP